MYLYYLLYPPEIIQTNIPNENWFVTNLVGSTRTVQMNVSAQMSELAVMDAVLI